MSAAFEVDVDVGIHVSCSGRVAQTAQHPDKSKIQVSTKVKVKIKSKSVGQECPTHTRLLQIEEQYLRVFCGFDRQPLLVANGGAVALVEALAVQFYLALRDLQPGVATISQFVSYFLSGLE